MSRTLAEVLADPARNNFTLVRLTAALMVVWGHAFGQFADRLNDDPTWSLLRGKEYSASLAVYAFFLTSGILVSQSFVRQKSVWRFVLLRAGRIWPAAAVSAVLVLLVIVPLGIEVPLSGYLSDPATGACLGLNLTLVQGACLFHPDAFPHVHQAHAIHLALWSLPVELHCYGLVLIAGVLGLLDRKFLTLALLLVVFAAFLWVARTPLEGMFWGDFRIIGGYSFYPLPFFLLGMALYALRDRVIVDVRVAIALCGIYCVLRGTPFEQAALYIAFAYVVLALAASPTVNRRLRLKNDYSYGIYIYGYPVGQLVATELPNVGFPYLLAVTFLAATALATLSWHFIEAPSLGWVRRIAGQRARREQLAASLAETSPETAP